MSAPHRNHWLQPCDGRDAEWSSVLAAGRRAEDFAIFVLKRPTVRADIEISGGLPLRSHAGMILPQVRMDAAASPAAPKHNVTSVSVESRFIPARLAMSSRWLRRVLTTDPTEAYRSARLSPASAASKWLHCASVEDYCPANTVIAGHYI